MDKRKKILIVDDDAALNDVLTNFIKANNFNVISTTKASLALKILKKEKIDLIITDINMPEMDGIEFIRKVREINNEVKIIVITGFPSPDSQQEAYNLGALNYLIKPFSSDRFKEIIENTLKLDMKSGNVIGQVELSIEDLIQMYSMEKKNIVLTIQKGKKKGEIFLHNGVVVHAQTESNVGEKAFFEIILLKSGIFTTRPYNGKGDISIKNKSVESLLLKGARIQDEILNNRQLQRNNEKNTLEKPNILKEVIFDKEDKKRINRMNGKTKMQKNEEVLKVNVETALKPVQEVKGYLASAIFGMNGDVLAQHNNSKYNVSIIGANAIAVCLASIKAIRDAGLGKVNFIQINSDKGIIGMVWAVEDKSVAAVLLEPDSNVGLAKINLSKVGEIAGSQLA